MLMPDRRVFLFGAFCLAAGLSLACTETYPTIEDRSLEKGAAVKLGKFHRQALAAAGYKAWELQGHEAYIFEKKRRQTRIVSYGFEFRQYDAKGKAIATIRAVRGEVDYDAKKLYLTGNVEFENNARTIRSQKMQYDTEEKIVTSDAPVVISERNLYTRCARGIYVDQKTQRQVCRGPVGTHTRPAGKSEGGVDDIFQ